MFAFVEEKPNNNIDINDKSNNENNDDLKENGNESKEKNKEKNEEKVEEKDVEKNEEKNEIETKSEKKELHIFNEVEDDKVFPTIKDLTLEVLDNNNYGDLVKKKIKNIHN